jgi:hypothetical protein
MGELYPIGFNFFFNSIKLLKMKKLNLAEFKLKMAKDDSNKQALLDKLAGATQGTCHDELICCITDPGDVGNMG